nr:hypothetical protein [uncultured Blautia sp.]
MASNIIPTNQIAKIQTNKKLIAFYDKLHIAPIEHYAQIHAKGETDQTNGKVSSLIGISIQDYSNGTGQNNIITQFNLAPEQVQFLLTRIEVGFQDFEWSSDKIFGTPDANGYSIAQKFVITRHSFKQDGTVLNNPWYISISNGHGIRVQNHTGGYYMKGYYMKGGSYQQEKSAFINLNDMDLYGLLKRTDAYIRNWEMFNAYQTILQGQQAYAQYLSTVRQQNQQRQAPGYPQENPAYTGDQYEQRPSDNYGQSQYQYSEPQYQYNNPNY